jgi:Zn-dependent protease
LDKFQSFILIAPVLLFSMVAHEYAHGYAALKQGDATAYSLGRLTWNPIPHIDLFMTIILPLVTWLTTGIAFGGAKPVPVIPRNYRNFKRGDIIVSLAGVATNALILLACVVLFALTGALGHAAPSLLGTLGVAQAMCYIGVQLNALLIAFNLLPIPPLDGSHVFKYLLPPPLAVQYVRFGRFGFIALIALLTWGERLLSAWMSPFFSVADGVLALAQSSLLPTTVQWVR